MIIVKKIIKTNDPKEQKKLGRQVKRFDKRQWEMVAQKIVYVYNMCKFTQNPELLKILLDSAGTTIVEASPFDKIWGIGLGETHPDALDRDKWRGTNWLGQILTDVRDNIMNGKLEIKI